MQGNLSLFTWRLFALISIVTLTACAYNPYRVTNRSYKKQAKAFSKIIKDPPGNIPSIKAAPYWVGTTNFNLRKPNFVIIHHTAQNSCPQTLSTFTMPRTQVSAHYVICKDGTVHHMLNDYLRAWHGGLSKWGNLTDVNSCSIGIELDNNGFEIFPNEQLNSLLQLLDSLKLKYSIPVPNFLGHADIAPTRKNDPNIYFPWKLLYERGFGRWYGDTTNLVLPAEFDNIQALRLVGYDVKDSIAAKIAFKRHFIQDTIPVFNQGDRKILYQLSSQW